MYKRLLATIVVAATMLSLVGCILGFPTDQFPAVRKGLRARVGQGTILFKMELGWYAGKQAWFICWDSNKLQRRDDLNLLAWVNPSPVPKLTSALGNGAMPLFVVTNFQQGPVFTTVPDRSDYSALWQVYTVTWRKGVVRRPIIDAEDLPSAAEADIVATDLVRNCPIMATGPLNGNNWTPAPVGSYRIKQALGVDVKTKCIVLPTWATFAQDPITKAIYQTEILITDSDDPDLVELLQCNFAPGLANVDEENTQRLWIFDWTTQPYSPPGQLPIMENTIKDDCHFNVNYAYSPINELVLVNRTPNGPNTVINNPIQLQKLISSGLLTATTDGPRMNVLEVNYWKWTNGWPGLPGTTPFIPGRW